MWLPQVYLHLTLRPLILAIDLIVLLTALAVVVLRVPQTFLFPSTLVFGLCREPFMRDCCNSQVFLLLQSLDAELAAAGRLIWLPGISVDDSRWRWLV